MSSLKKKVHSTSFMMILSLDSYFKGAAQPLEGASRTVGGVIRGQARGNVFSLADAPDAMQDRFQAKGLVKVYKSCIDTFSDFKPTMVLKSEVTPSIGPILRNLSRRYSPVSSMFLHYSHFSSYT